MITVDRGSTVMIEVEFKRTAPFGTEDYFDPTAPKITIKDSTGTAKVTEGVLLRQATGKWYYLCQTATNWTVGQYSAVVTATDGTYTDTTTEPRSFYLK